MISILADIKCCVMQIITGRGREEGSAVRAAVLGFLESLSLRPVSEDEGCVVVKRKDLQSFISGMKHASQRCDAVGFQQHFC